MYLNLKIDETKYEVSIMFKTLISLSSSHWKVSRSCRPKGLCPLILLSKPGLGGMNIQQALLTHVCLRNRILR